MFKNNGVSSSDVDKAIGGITKAVETLDALSTKAKESANVFQAESMELGVKAEEQLKQAERTVRISTKLKELLE